MFLAHSIAATAPGPGDDFWYGPAASRSLAGVTVSPETALRLSTVYKCVRVRAETIGMLPLMVYRRMPDGRGKDVARDHPLYALLHDQPNPWQTAMGWRQMMQAHLDLRGNAYAELIYSGAGRLEMLVPINPDTVRVEVMSDGWPRYLVRNAKGRDRVLVRGEILHVAGLSADGYCGLNPIELERESIGAGIAARDYGSRYFLNGARPPFWVKFDGKFESAKAKQEWVQKFADRYGGANSGKVPVMERGMTIEALGVKNSDAEYMAWRKATEIDIAGIYRVPPHKLGILDRATWGNIEHQQTDFVSDAILPSCATWEQSLLRDLDFGDDSFPEFKLSGLLRGDTTTRFSAYGKGIKDGWMTRNEARLAESMNPIDGLDEPLQPLNMAPAGAAVEAAEPEDDEDETRASSGERHALILSAAAERAARRECSMWRKVAPVGADYARWLSEVLAVSESAAQARAEALPGIFAECGQSMTDAAFISARAAELLRLEV